jgi:hypothetical protein
MLALLLAGVIAAAADTTSAPASPPPPAAPAPHVAKKDPLVCHSDTSTGSRLVTKTCMLASEWELRGRQDRQELQQAQGVYRPSNGEMMNGPMGPPHD